MLDSEGGTTSPRVKLKQNVTSSAIGVGSGRAGDVPPPHTLTHTLVIQ